MQTALDNRPDVQQIRINIENAKIGLKSSRSQLLPSLELQGTLQNNALVGQVNDLLLRGQPVPRVADPFFLGGFGDALGQLFRRNFPDYSIGFSFNIPIRNRSAQADMILDQLSVRQAELNEQRTLNQLRVDIENSVIALRQARARYEAAVKERVLQEQTLDAEQKKYALGASTVFFVIQYQRDLALAQSNEVAALSAYAKAQTSQYRVLGETLKVYNIDITEAKTGRVTTAPARLPTP
jgi:outer membrane protein TolC